MKLKKQKYLILLVLTLFNVASIYAGPTPPSPGGGGSGGAGGAPPVLPGTPIDSEIIFLFIAALVLGLYKIIQFNKKRQFEK